MASGSNRGLSTLSHGGFCATLSRSAFSCAEGVGFRLLPDPSQGQIFSVPKTCDVEEIGDSIDRRVRPRHGGRNAMDRMALAAARSDSHSD